MRLQLYTAIVLALHISFGASESTKRCKDSTNDKQTPLQPSNTPTTPSSSPTSENASGIDVKVSGNKLVDASGNVFRCHGANLQGTEYKCIQGSDFSEGTIDQTYVSALKKWNVNCARIPLNEDCMLGTAIPGVKNGTYIGDKYLAAVKAEVNLLLQNNIAVILDLHWVHGKDGATKQWSMTDKYSPQFWTLVAKSFSLPGVIFDLYNEPFVQSWDCWLKGGTACTSSDQVDGWTATGMQDNINAVRQAGSKNPVLIQGLEWGGNPTGMLTHTPTDPANQMISGFHNYNFNGCITPDCWAKEFWPVAQKFPMMIGELGENDCKHDYVDKLMAAADEHGIGYLGWAWFATGDCAKGPTMISSWDGTPTGMGEGFQKHYLSLGAGGGGAAPAATAGGGNNVTTQPATGAKNGGNSSFLRQL